MRLASDDLGGAPGPARAEALLPAGVPPALFGPVGGGSAGPWIAERPPLTVGPLRIDLQEARAFVDGVDAGLTWTELILLDDLVRHRGRLRWRHDLMREILGYSPQATTRALDSHMFRLRNKLGEVGKRIATVRGMGFRFCLE